MTESEERNSLLDRIAEIDRFWLKPDIKDGYNVLSLSNDNSGDKITISLNEYIVNDLMTLLRNERERLVQKLKEL